MKKIITAFLLTFLFFGTAIAQNDVANINQLNVYKERLVKLGDTFINNPEDMERKNANYEFIKTLVGALKVPNSFLYSFAGIKSISVINSPDNRFRIFSWPVINEDGSYRFYGTIQMNTGGKLLMYPLEDYSPLLKNPEDSVTDNHKWFGAMYYKIISVNSGSNPYYILLGWKGNTVKSTKKVIDVISFKNNKPVLGAPVFESKNKTRNRVVFEYSRQASMLLRYIADENLIVFDHLAPPDKQSALQPDTFGPDLSYDGYRLKNGKWTYVENLDMRNIPQNGDDQVIDPKQEAIKARQQIQGNN